MNRFRVLIFNWLNANLRLCDLDFCKKIINYSREVPAFQVNIQ